MHVLRAAAAVLLSLAAGAAFPGVAAPGWPEALAPAASLQFAFAGGAEGRNEVAAAIERTIAEMSFIVRPFARSRLTGANRVAARLKVWREGAELLVDRDGSLVRSPTDGSPARWVAPDGKEVQVRQSLEGAVLTQRFTAEDGERLNTFVLSPDGSRLRLAVEVRSARLPAPLVYALDYMRE